MTQDQGGGGAGEKDVAFYYPGPFWYSAAWVKNLLLFFDGIALLVPEYMTDRPEILEPEMAIPLRDAGLLHVLKPETLVDKTATGQLATALTAVLTSGALDPLIEKNPTFQELSWSRLGGYGDEAIARTILQDLKARGLARDTEDGYSIPMYSAVRSLVLVLLAQILRPQGAKYGFELSPATDRPELVEALTEMLSLETSPSRGHVVSWDLDIVGVDLSDIPIDEVLSFRTENLALHRKYARDVRRFVRDLSLMPSGSQRRQLMTDRKEELTSLKQEILRASIVSTLGGVPTQSLHLALLVPPGVSTPAIWLGLRLASAVQYLVYETKKRPKPALTVIFFALMNNSHKGIGQRTNREEVLTLETLATLSNAKDLAAIGGALVALAALVRGVIEYSHQGAQKRAEHFLEMRKRFVENSVFRDICALLETDAPQLRDVPFKEKRDLLGFFEEIALLMNSGLIRPQVAHYMFGYYAIRCSESNHFWVDVSRESIYWSLFRDFVQSMTEREGTFSFKRRKFRF
ncbi:MAG TPA: hypothetical protein VHG32_16985 [Thermoanaerobaculia bacterium]|jgi:hypothetical protein|nr:hypothetical protein [Thermoanaerobaculia bacterium]